MITFALEEIELEIEEGAKKFSFHSLIVNGNNGYLDFKSFCQGNKVFEKELKKIETIIIEIAKGNASDIPPTKHKQLKTGGKDKYPDYEIKTSNLRLYFIKDNDNKIIVLGGLKKNQKKDISKLRKIKKQYHEN